MKKVVTLTFGLAAASTALMTIGPATAAENPSPVAPAAVSAEGVRSISLPAVPLDLPDAPGKNLVTANCILCHSPQYILMQPAFPRKVWEAEVDKMRKTFGAPVAEPNVGPIVDYLMAIRGAPQPATKSAGK
ncbi:MAG: hypothetical protein JWO31_3892 [Phycisphaerales bacterium]|nr:hypothetical protein [Phycisphaerales bacterium]